MSDIRKEGDNKMKRWKLLVGRRSQVQLSPDPPNSQTSLQGIGGPLRFARFAKEDWERVGR